MKVGDASARLRDSSKLTQYMMSNVGTLNVGSMTGRGRELVDLMERRKVGVLFVQETRRKGNQAR